MIVAAVAALLGGLIIGSFLNVVAWRLPRGESLSHPGSHCPSCDAPIKPYDNIPVLSWLLLRGKCRDCGEPISPRYPLVEAGTALSFVLVGWLFLPTEADLASPLAAISAFTALAAFLYLAAISIALALIDLDTFLLPDKIVLPA